LRHREFLLQTLPAACERREEERKRLLDLAATYQRAADAMAPESRSQRSEMALFARKAYARKQTTDLTFGITEVEKRVRP
jgi:hypothetical protein